MDETTSKVSHLVFFNATDLLVYSLGEKTFFIINDKQNIKTFKFFKNSVNYSLCKGEKEIENGLYFYNLENVIKNVESGEIKTLLFKNIDLGCNTNLIYSQDEMRIGYFNELSHITVVPLLHINMIKFLGIKPFDFYFAYKVIKDKFIALHWEGKIQTWSMISGKFLSEHKLKNNWVKDYTMFHPQDEKWEINTNRKNKVILRSREEFSERSLNDHY